MTEERKWKTIEEIEMSRVVARDALRFAEEDLAKIPEMIKDAQERKARAERYLIDLDEAEATLRAAAEGKEPPMKDGYFVLGFYDAFDGWSVFDTPFDDKVLGLKRYKTREEAQAVADEKNALLGQGNKNMNEHWQVFSDKEARRFR